MVRKGSKAHFAQCAAPAKAAANAAEEALGFIPADPADPRLRVDGAVCGADGKIDIEAYEDIMDCWKGEPSPQNHPNPLHPGVRNGEEIPKGLRMWDDVRAGNTGKDGAGWVAVKTSVRFGKKEKWFNIRTCRSWRLAFLFARLQREIWERETLPSETLARLEAARLAAAEKAASSTTSKATPTKRLKSPAPAQSDTPAKRAKMAIALGEDSNAKPILQQKEQPTQAQPATKLSSVLERIRLKMEVAALVKKEAEGA